MAHVKILNRSSAAPVTIPLWYNNTNVQPFDWTHQIHYWRLVRDPGDTSILLIDGQIEIPNATIIALQPTTTILKRTSEIGVDMGIRTIQFRLLHNDYHYTAYFPSLKHTIPYNDRNAKHSQAWISDQLTIYNNWHQQHNAGTH